MPTRSAVCFLLAAAAASAPPARAQPAGELPPAAVEVRLFDPYGLLPKELESLVRHEVVLAFAASGVEVRFVRAAGPGVVPATIYPELPSGWGTPPGAVGVAIGAPGGPRSVFLSLGAAERALGIPRPVRHRPGVGPRRPPARGRHLGIALGRVLAHELAHAVAPSCPHTSTGLMAPHFSRDDLIRPGIAFDDLAGRYLREAVGAPDGSG